MSDDPPSSAEAWLDFGYLAELIEIDPADIEELVRCMIADAPGMLQQIAEAMAAGDREAAKTVSHTLRGMLLNFGCQAIAERLLHFEKSGWAAGSGEDPAQVAQALWQSWEGTRRALEAWLAEVAPPR